MKQHSSQLLYLIGVLAIMGQIAHFFAMKHHHHSSSPGDSDISSISNKNNDAAKKLASLEAQLLQAGNNLAAKTRELEDVRLHAKPNSIIPLIESSKAMHYFNDNKLYTGTKINNATQHRPRLAIAIISAFDWLDRGPTARHRRQIHRDTWMTHSAVVSGNVVAYFVIGKQQHERYQGKKDTATHAIDELQEEMDHYGDIVLLDSYDWHNAGKMNAWYEWASLDKNIQADYHMKLDDESYVHLDHLLGSLEKKAREKFLGGTGAFQNQRHIVSKDNIIMLNRIPWLKGWGYIMSQDVIKDLGNCSKTGELLKWNKGQDEDTYNAVAMRLCRLDNGLSFFKNMHVLSLRNILVNNCPEENDRRAAVIHCGMRSGGHKPGDSVNAFTKVPIQTFHALQNIFYPLPGDKAASWTKWENLRILYLDDLGACRGEQGKGHSCLVHKKLFNRKCSRHHKQALLSAK